MPESTEVLLARIDERTKAMHIDIKELNGHNKQQDTKIESLEKWRNGLAGAFSLGVFLFGLFIKFGA